MPLWLWLLLPAVFCAIAPFTSFGEQIIWWPIAVLGWVAAAGFTKLLEAALEGWGDTLRALRERAGTEEDR